MSMFSIIRPRPSAGLREFSRGFTTLGDTSGREFERQTRMVSARLRGGASRHYAKTRDVLEEAARQTVRPE